MTSNQGAEGGVKCRTGKDLENNKIKIYNTITNDKKNTISPPICGFIVVWGSKVIIYFEQKSKH